jgi:hypothetical protein
MSPPMIVGTVSCSSLICVTHPLLMHIVRSRIVYVRTTDTMSALRTLTRSEHSGRLLAEHATAAFEDDASDVPDEEFDHPGDACAMGTRDETRPGAPEQPRCNALDEEPIAALNNRAVTRSRNAR